ncbi:hypothetical protein AB0X98_01170 [Rothia koreensis]|uniref:hypothetical protein n=1 Tax=Rothia koreensis TaxID=592378 RepID=UPI003F276B1B
MARRVDLKSPPADSLRMILGQATTTHTRPFGQKAAKSGEGINYGTSTGQVLRWDGDAVADYDARIREAKQLVVEATAGLDQAEAGLAEARDRISQVEAGTTPEAIGSTAAGQINQNRLLVGRDAILTGTVDVAQLNVTEQMSAEIVRAMSTETRQLVVTEDAILNRATIIESLVTPELVADRIDVRDLGARMVTAGAIQTDPNQSQGIKITDAGIEGFDQNSQQTMRIDGKNNLLIGDLATAPKSQTGVKITSRGSLAAIDMFSNIEPDSAYAPHGAAWFDAPSGNMLGSAMHLAATMSPSLQNGDPEIVLAPLQKGIAFNPKFLNGQAMKFGVVESPNLGKDQWVTMNVRFGSAMPTGGSVMVFVSPITADGGECAVGIKDCTQTGFTAIVKNVAGRATGYAWMKWMAVNVSY